MSMHEVKIEVDITKTDKFRAVASVLAKAITTHPNRRELERELYESAGVTIEQKQNKCSG